MSQGFFVGLVVDVIWAVAYWTLLGGPLLFFDLYGAGLPQGLIFLVGTLVSLADYVVGLAAFLVTVIFIVYGISTMVPAPPSIAGPEHESQLIRRLARTGRGLLAGVLAGIVWGGVSILGQSLFFTVFHSAILAETQASIPAPQPLLPGFPELGFTQPPNTDGLIAAYAHVLAIITLIIGLWAGGLFGLFFSASHDSFFQRQSTILKSALLGLIFWAGYSVPLIFQTSPLGDAAKLFSLATSLSASLFSSSLLGYFYQRINTRIGVRSSLISPDKSVAGGLS